MSHTGNAPMRSRGLPVRFRLLGVLFVVSFANYLLRNNISVSLPAIKDEFAFSNVELGWILGSFNVAYTLFQFPGGIFGEALGPRRALTVIALAWAVLTAMTGFVPGLLFATGAGALVGLMTVRFLMGIANAPMYPVAAGAIASWFPVAGWGLPNTVLSTGLALGQASLGPVITWLVFQYGWRESFYLTAPVGLVVAAWWWWYGRDKPRQHKAVSREELALIEGGRLPPDAAPPLEQAWKLVLVNREILLLAGSYFCMNYVFYMFAQWLFTYLVEERGLGVLESGLLYALPFIVGAVMAPFGGAICDFLCRRIGPRWGCRLPGIVGLVMVAWLMLVGALAANPYVAVLLLSLCFGFTQFTEGAYWSGTTFAAGPHTAMATGVLNTGGNLVGFLAPVIGLVVDRLGWLTALSTGSLFALVGALLWLFIRPDHPLAKEEA